MGHPVVYGFTKKKANSLAGCYTGSHFNKHEVQTKFSNLAWLAFSKKQDKGCFHMGHAKLIDFGATHN